MEDYLLVVPIAILLAGAFILLGIDSLARGKGAGLVALATMAIAVLALTIIKVGVGRETVYENYFVWGSIGSYTVSFGYYMDGLSFFFALTALLLAAFAILGTLLSDSSPLTRQPGLLVLALLLEASLLHTLFSSTLLIAYLGWESLGLVSLFLVTYGPRLQAISPSKRLMLILGHAAGGAFLLGVLFAAKGSLSSFSWLTSSSIPAWVGLLFVIAVMGRSAAYALYGWLPRSYPRSDRGLRASSPSSDALIAVLLAVAFLGLPVYLTTRLFALLQGPGLASAIGSTLVVGAVIISLGTIFSFQQRRLEQLLGILALSQGGYVLLGLGTGIPLGQVAALYQFLALFPALLLLRFRPGFQENESGEEEQGAPDPVGGAYRGLATIVVLAAVAATVVGLPPSGGFVARWFLYEALLLAGRPDLMALVLATTVLPGILLIMLLRPWVAEILNRQARALQLNRDIIFAIVPLLAILLIGIYPPMFISSLIAPTSKEVLYATPFQLQLVGSSPVALTIWPMALLFASSGPLLALAIYLLAPLAWSHPITTGIRQNISIILETIRFPDLMRRTSSSRLVTRDPWAVLELWDKTVEERYYLLAIILASLPFFLFLLGEPL